jgi:LPS-assembly protein
LRAALLILPLCAALLAPWTAHAQAAPASCPQTDFEDEMPPAPAGSDPSLDQRLIITADEGQLVGDGLSLLSGGVRLRQGEREFSAAELSYDDAEKQIRIRVESLFRNRDLIIKSGESLFDLRAGSGTFSDTEFSLRSRSARGSAELMTITADRELTVEEARFTTCPRDAQSWQLRADRIALDHESGLGTARGTVLHFGGVPVLWMPWFQFPIDDRRRTGILFPTVGETDRTGFDLRVPVYLNLAPNYDATVTPRLMSDRGLQLGGEARYLIARGQGEMRAEYLDEDKSTGERRSYVQGDLIGLFNPRLGYRLNLGATSDRRYFEDLGGESELTSLTHLERAARLTYQAPAAYSITAMAQSYQTIASNLLPVDQPYARLPQIRVRALTKNRRFHTRASFAGEYVNFVRSDSIEGQRLDLNPSLRTAFDDTAWFAALQADYRYTAYALTGTLPGQDDRPTRSLPQFSAEGGLRFDRFTGDGKLQTLEPYLFYLYTPFRDQSELPIFDTGQPDFDYTQLFARNRFSGEDRIADANHVVVAARSRLLDPDSGEVRLSASVGQLMRLQASRVQVLGVSTPDSGPTDFFADLGYHLSSRWSAQLTSAWSPDEERFNRIGFGLHYRDSSYRADLSYRYRRGLFEQADFAGSLPLFDRWRVAMRTRYSILDDATLDHLVGVEYETCCYALRTSYRRYVATTAGEYNSGVYLQLELKGLTRIGAGFDGLLPLTEDDDGKVRY